MGIKCDQSVVVSKVFLRDIANLINGVTKIPKGYRVVAHYDGDQRFYTEIKAVLPLEQFIKESDDWR